MTETVSHDTPPETSRKLQGTLGVPAIVFMVVAAAAPLSVLGSTTGLGFLIGNGVGFPSMFIISAVILLLFAVGISTMARHVPRPGAFFTYVGYGLNRSVGLGAAWIAILAYTAVQIAVYAYIGYLLSISLAGLGAPLLPWWFYSLLVALIVGFLGFRHIDLSSKVLAVVLISEVAVVLILVGAVMLSGGAEGLSLAPFEPTNVVSGSPGLGLMFSIAAFVGFEATAIFRDEAKTPERTIPRATYTAVIGVGLFYALASWAMTMAWGPDNIVEEAEVDPAVLILRTFTTYLGPVSEVIVNILLVASLFACVLAFHNVLTRYLHSMANAGALPGSLGLVHKQHRSPHISSLTQTLTVVVLVGMFAILGLDPILQVLTWLAGISTLAIVILMLTTSIAVIVYFARTRLDRRVWQTVIAPILGLIGLSVAAGLIVMNYPMMVEDVDANGNYVFGTLTWFLIFIVIVFPIFGLAQAEWMRRRNPTAYGKLTDAIADAVME